MIRADIFALLIGNALQIFPFLRHRTPKAKAAQDPPPMRDEPLPDDYVAQNGQRVPSSLQINDLLDRLRNRCSA